MLLLRMEVDMEMEMGKREWGIPGTVSTRHVSGGQYWEKAEISMVSPELLCPQNYCPRCGLAAHSANW